MNRSCERLAPVAVLVASLFGQVGCDSTFETDIYAMKNKRVTLEYYSATNQLGAVLAADGCPVLVAGATASLNGRPVALDRGLHREPNPGTDDQGACIAPRVLADLKDETTSVLELEISDASQTISVTLTDYHPFPFTPNAPNATPLHPGDVVTLSTPLTADMPDEIVVYFNAIHIQSNAPTWMTAGVLADGRISFTVPADSVIDNGQLAVCGGYSVKTKIGPCVNATCAPASDALTRDDCGLFNDVWIVKPGP